jgi:excisionase family DNA binding protein
MQASVTLDEAARHLRVEEADVMALIDQGKMRAIRIRESLRIPEREFERLLTTCSAGNDQIDKDEEKTESAPLISDGSRWVPTRSGRSRFRVAGSITTGAEMWLGRMRYPIKMPKSFMDRLLSHFADSEVTVGGSFDGPPPGSLGEFIQRELPTRMNPAVFLAALLIDEGFAEAGRRGYIRFCRRSKPISPK